MLLAQDRLAKLLDPFLLLADVANIAVEGAMCLLSQVVQFVKSRFGDVLQVEAGDDVVDSLVEGATGNVEEAQFVQAVI